MRRRPGGHPAWPGRAAGPAEPGRGASSTEPARPGLLAEAEVHAWLVDLDAAAHLLAVSAVLSPAEHDRADSYLRPVDGMRFAASRACLRMILGRYLGADAAVVRLASARDSRPGLAEVHGGALHYSLSRAASRCLVAVSRAPVGADIEQVSDRPELADLVTARFGQAEADCLTAGCGGTEVRGFYRHWTAKEAYLKATGHGLARLRDTALVCDRHPVIEFAGRPAPGWAVSLLEPTGDYMAAIVGVGQLTRWQPAELLAAGPAVAA